MSDTATHPRTTLLAPQGIGFGEGSISVRAQLESGELTQESLDTAIEILRSDTSIFVPISPFAVDDGCGDGRPSGAVFQYIGGVREEFNKSLARAKVFGGGLIAASSMWRIISGAPGANDTVYSDREFVVGLLRDHHVSYGAHTDNHAHGDACGCGAIDKYPAITANIIKYKEQIDATLHAVYGDDYSASAHAIQTVFARYQSIANSPTYMADASGRKTMDLIERSGAVVKELADAHLEDLVVFNYVVGTTLDQRALDQTVRDAGVATEVQCFAVDVWRGEFYAKLMARVFARQGHDETEVYAIAMADFYIRTLAVAATLTAGDLPVLVRA